MSDDALRARIERLLVDGLTTDSTRRAYTSEDVVTVCRYLQALAPDDLEGRLAVAGFTRQPYVDPGDEVGLEQACATCMYYERHRRFCDLPELMLPVEPQWSCILWRI
jgi:hypothetical protein